MTSPGLLFCSLQARRGLDEASPWILDSDFPAERAAPMVSVLDGHPHTLAFLAGVHRVSAAHLGVRSFGQSGDLERLQAARPRHRHRRRRRPRPRGLSRIRYQTDTISFMAMTLRTDDELDRALTALAEAEGTSRQEIVRRAVLERFERSGHTARVQESSARLAERWGDVLDRLGTV